MAITFRIVLAGPAADVATILLKVEEPLANMGFRRDRVLRHTELESDDALNELAEVPSLSQAGEELREWNGLSAHYMSPDFEFGAQFYRWGTGFVNAYVGIDKRALSRLFATRTADRFYTPLIAIAQAMRAEGGFGDTELPFDPVKPDAVTSLFFNSPDRGPFLIGLFALGTLSKDQLNYLEQDEYDVWQRDGYLLAQDRAFVEISSKYAK